MAIGRISGPMLFSNLERQGVDLAFQSNLLYLDVNNLRVGVINSSPQYALDSSGNVKLANIVVLGNTITSNTGKINLGSTSNVVITGGSADNVLYTDGNGNLNWGQISDLDFTWDDITLTSGNAAAWYATNLNATNANLISTTATNLSASNILVTSGNITANLTGNINGTFSQFTGNVTANYFIGNIASESTTVTGNVSANLLIGNIYTQQITSPVGDLHFSAATNDPNNIIRFDSVSAFDIPSGTTEQRPPNPDSGYVRYNTDLGSIEWWGGSQWVSGSNLLSTQQILPNGTNDTYTLDQSTVENAILVNINGTIQQAGAGAYSVTGNQITFAEIPLVTDIIEIRFLASGVAALTMNFANIPSNVSPSANVTFDLGSSTKRWRDLWLSGNTIHLANATISSTGDAIQLPAGSTVGGATVDITSINANITAANASIQTTQANIGAYQTYANSNVAAIQANIGAYQTYANSNVVVIQANIGAYQTYANSNVAAIQANIGAYQTYANSNVAAIQANIGAYQTYANANASTQASSIDTLNANIGAFYTYANTKIGTNTDSNLVITSTTVSTSGSTGALVVAGGAGVAGNVVVGANLRQLGGTINSGYFYANVVLNQNLFANTAYSTFICNASPHPGTIANLRFTLPTGVEDGREITLRILGVPVTSLFVSNGAETAATGSTVYWIANNWAATGNVTAKFVYNSSITRWMRTL